MNTAIAIGLLLAALMFTISVFRENNFDALAPALACLIGALGWSL